MHHAALHKTKIVNADRVSRIFLIASVVYLIGILLSLLGLVKVAVG
jgi:hypothetical protein